MSSKLTRQAEWAFSRSPFMMRLLMSFTMMVSVIVIRDNVTGVVL